MTCDKCRYRLTPCYPGQTLHPMCDPAPQGWTAEQLAEWGPGSTHAKPPNARSVRHDRALLRRRLRRDALTKGDLRTIARLNDEMPPPEIVEVAS